jgi:ribonucleoside-diphosphate reductase beta chain
MKEITHEVLLKENKDRFVLLPIKYPDIWEMYKSTKQASGRQKRSISTRILKDWDSLSKNEKHFISHVLAFFAASDGIVK